MDFHSAFEFGNAVAELAEDAYQVRDRLADKNGWTYLPYRVSISDHEEDVHVNFYFHVVFFKGNVWYTVSDEADFSIDHDELVFWDGHDNKSDYLIRARSYRRYIFKDLFNTAVEKKVEAVSAALKNPSKPHLWDTLPLATNFRITEKGYEAIGENPPVAA